MTAPADRLVVDPQGTVRAEPALVPRLRALAGRYELLTSVPGLLTLRSSDLPTDKRARVLLAGEIVSRMSMMEIMNIIAQANWRGDLYTIEPDLTRILSFDQGMLRGAQSEAPDERLGEVMFRAGLLSREQLEDVVASRGSKRFGERCVELGYIDAAKLFELLQKQAETVFYGAMLTSEGHFAFVQPPAGETDSRAATFHLPIQGLLMEGVQRIDEMALFRDKIPDSGLCPQPVQGAPERKLDDAAKKVLALCDGARSIDDLARITSLGEFLTTKAVYHLLQGKQVTLRSAPKVKPEQVDALVSRFNEVLQDIFLAVATYGGLSQSHASVTAWLTASGYLAIFGGGIDDFGMLDVRKVQDTVGHRESDRPLEDLQKALHELAAFSLFSATTSLPRDQEIALARDVNTRLKGIRVG